MTKKRAAGRGRARKPAAGAPVKKTDSKGLASEQPAAERPASRKRASAPPPSKWRALGVWRWVIAAAVVVVVAIGAFLVTAQATDAPTFCGICHEMQPYYDAWKVGHHAHSAQCVECHVEPGASQRLTHKFVALGEVWAHFTGFAGFPMAQPADMPDSRCIACHPTVKPKNMPAAFSHEMHAKRGPCALCHSTTGHDVAATALQSTGVYNAANAAARATAHSAKATPGAGKADLPGHVNVVCTNCHDMAATGCPACHQPGHEPRGDCAQCHKPGPRFTFVHPTTTMPGWQSMQCRTCHPTSYTQVNCTCHKNGQPEGN